MYDYSPKRQKNMFHVDFSAEAIKKEETKQALMAQICKAAQSLKPYENNAGFGKPKND